MVTKLRVAHIITQLELGGAQRNTLYTVKHLDENLFEPSLVSGPGGILDEEVKSEPSRTYFLKHLVRPVRPFRDFLAVCALYRWFRTHRPHIVHTHSSKAGILGRIAAYFAGIPVIIHTFHGFGFTPGQSAGVRNFYIALERFCARLSTHLIFVSEANREEARSLGIGATSPDSLIRSGIELVPPVGSHIRKELGIPSDAWVVTSIGNFKPQKNPLDLVKVAAGVLEKDRTIHFILVGDGELRSEAENYLSNYEFAAQVHFLGWRADANEILVGSNAFLLTSLWEGLPRALVEAFAASLPAVAYGVDGVKDILVNDQTGFLIPTGETSLAAEKVLWLKEHPEEAKRMGLQGRHLIETDFDINLMVRQQAALYARCYEEVPLKDYYEPTWNVFPPVN